MTRTALLCALALGLGGCGGEAPGAASAQPAAPAPTPAQVAAAEDLEPADAELAATYNRSCRTCHAMTGMNAPLTGHAEAWAQRLAARGRDGLLASTKHGYNAMPARGLCADCSDAQFLALIDFMAGGAAPAAMGGGR